jgi:hypothetical protein
MAECLTRTLPIRRPVLRSYQERLRVCSSELHDEVARQILGLGFAPFLTPETNERGFIAAHDDAGVRTADKGAAISFIANDLAKRHCNLHTKIEHHPARSGGL